MARTAKVERKTTETSIIAEVNLDGTGEYDVSTGIGFLDHMVEQFSRHSLIDVKLKAKGDLHIDYHHTTEDVAITLGKAVAKALGDKAGIQRYADAHVPMDETLTRVAVDLSGRAYVVWKVKFSRDKVGDMDTELFREWFFAFGNAMQANIHVENIYGDNNHHIVESCYKGLARTIRTSITIDERKKGDIPSTKGVI